MHRNALLRLCGLFFVLLLSNCFWARKSEGNDERFTLFITAELNGQLTPCGCSENMLGGISKIAHLLDEARQSPFPISYVDVGNSLFGHENLPEGARLEQKKKAETLALALSQMKVALVVAGDRDDLHGANFRSTLALPWLEQNQMHLLNVGRRKVAVISSASSRDITRLATEARENHADFVLAVAPKSIVLEKSNEIKGLDLLMTSDSEGALANEENRLVRASPTWAQIQSRGRTVLRVDVNPSIEKTPMRLRETSNERLRAIQALDERIEALRKQINSPSLSPEARQMRQEKLEDLANRRLTQFERQHEAPLRPAEFAIQFLPIESHFAPSVAIQSMVAKFEQEAERFNLEGAQAQNTPCPNAGAGQPSIVGSHTCQGCHAETYQTWKATKHAHAYDSLVEKRSQFRWQCISCHVTGFEQPGGVCRIDKVEARENVGCESCHGPGSNHVDAPSSQGSITRVNAEDMCVSCHNVENSPHFEFKTYLPLILGRGHESREKKPPPKP